VSDDPGAGPIPGGSQMKTTWIYARPRSCAARTEAPRGRRRGRPRVPPSPARLRGTDARHGL